MQQVAGSVGPRPCWAGGLLALDTRGGELG